MFNILDNIEGQIQNQITKYNSSTTYYYMTFTLK